MLKYRHNLKKIVNANFWISEFLILMLSNHFRWIEALDIIGAMVLLLLLLITAQYCMLHMRVLNKCGFRWYYILFLESSYVLATMYIVIGNMFWFAHSYQVNFTFFFGLTVILCPMVIVNTKLVSIK